MPKPANLKILSQRTGEFISQDDNEPGVVVNMDDVDVDTTIAKLRGEAYKPKGKGKELVEVPDDTVVRFTGDSLVETPAPFIPEPKVDFAPAEISE